MQRLCDYQMQCLLKVRRGNAVGQHTSDRALSALNISMATRTLRESVLALALPTVK